MDVVETAAPFVCGSCCYVATYLAPIGNTFSLPVWPTVLSGIQILSLGFLLLRMSHIYTRGVTEGFKYVQSPVEALRLENKARSHYIPPFYFSYIIFNSIFMLLEIVGALPDETPELDWLFQFLSPACEAFDMALVIYVCLPRITRVTRWIPLMGALVVFIAFALYVEFLPAPPRSQCPWCSQHFPKSDISYLYLAEGVITFVLFVWAWRQPFKSGYNPRPAAAILCGYWSVIYIALGTVLPIMKANYPSNIDWEFCVLLVVVSGYYLAYPFVIYSVIIRDAKYVWDHKLDENILGRNDPMDESTERLIREYPMSELIDILQEKTLPSIPSSEITLLEPVGVGGFGQVFKATWGGTTVAVKSLLRLSESELQAFVREMALLSRLRHPHIMLIMGIVLEADKQYLITEFAACGTLFEALHSPKSPQLTWDTKVRVAHEMAMGIAYLHGKGVVHRDLKPGNILLGSNFSVRVADFGLSRELTLTRNTMTGLGTMLYSSPEMLRQEYQGKEVDVWAFGCILWEMACERLPYDDPISGSMGVGRFVMGLVNDQLHLDDSIYPEAIPALFRSLIGQCTQHAPVDRVTFEQILASFEADLN